MVYISGEKEELTGGREEASQTQDGPSADEMSMDEVLASIRKIIATDDEEASEAPQSGVDEAKHEKKEIPTEKQEDPQDDDVLELTKEVSSEGEIIDHKKEALDQVHSPENADSEAEASSPEEELSEAEAESEDVQSAAEPGEPDDDGAQNEEAHAPEVKPNEMDALSEEEFHGEEHDDEDVSNFLNDLESEGAEEASMTEESEEKQERAVEMGVHDAPNEGGLDEEGDAGDEIVFGAEEENEDESASQSQDVPEDAETTPFLDEKEENDPVQEEKKEEGLIDEDELEEFMAPQELEEEDVEEFLDDSSAEPEAFDAPDRVIREEIEVEKQEMTEKKGLISEATKVSAMGALNKLKNHVSEASEATKAPNAGGGSLEALVMRGMEPLLKDWLDQNLPSLVEKVVQEEIRKLTKGS